MAACRRALPRTGPSGPGPLRPFNDVLRDKLPAVFGVSRLNTATFCILDQCELNDSGYRTTFGLRELFSQS